jgi:hypothetical protein
MIRSTILAALLLIGQPLVASQMAVADCAADDFACKGANKPPKSNSGGGGIQQNKAAPTR